ncbi:MAG: hypothetical protein IMW89_17140 [Ktedonobacteraceae bacterium]|nr:hypothetical protein [Ktedonobacteraceae bacterium]
MEQQTHHFFSEQNESEDEFDRLVTKLLHVEPPESLVDNILRSVTQKPSIAEMLLPRIVVEHGHGGDDQGELLIEHTNVQPS